MRKSFKGVRQPMIAGVVKERTPEAAIAEIENCEYHGATGIDLHVSCLDKAFHNSDAIARIVNSTKLPILALNYNQSYENGFYEASEDERVGLLLTAFDGGCAAIDMQGYTFDLPSKTAFNENFADAGYSFIKNNPKEVVLDEKIIARQVKLIDTVHEKGGEVLFSTHTGVPMTAEQVVELALFVEKRTPDIIKIVTPAISDEDMIEAMRAMLLLKKEVKTPVSYHCSGAKGMLTRVINPVLGGFMCFCNDSYQHNSTMEQPELQTAKAVIDGIKKII